VAHARLDFVLESPNSRARSARQDSGTVSGQPELRALPLLVRLDIDGARTGFAPTGRAIAVPETLFHTRTVVLTI